MPHGSHGHGGWGHGGWHHPRGGYGGFFDFVDYSSFDPAWGLALTQFDPSQMVDQSQMFDPLFDPSQMVDLSQTDPRLAQALEAHGDLSQPIPGPGVVGLYGLFEGDFRRVGDDEPPPRPRGLLLLGAKGKKAWKPRRLGVERAAPPHLGAMYVRPWWT